MDDYFASEEYSKAFERFYVKVECKLHKMGYDAWSRCDIEDAGRTSELDEVDFFFKCIGRWDKTTESITDNINFIVRNRYGWEVWGFDITRFDITDSMTVDYVYDNFIRLHHGLRMKHENSVEQAV